MELTKRLVLSFLLIFCADSAIAFCSDLVFEGLPFTVCRADPAKDDIRLWLNDEDGELLGSFAAVEEALADSARALVFATNGGMYHPDRSPVGHYIERGEEIRGVITSAGPGNFGMLPNGVLCVTDASARVWESRAYARARPDCDFATQSGPMLVIEGQLHRRFLVDSTSRFVRNGVGVTSDGTLFIAISNRPVTFHEFGRFFRDELATPNALYLDGNVSRLHAPNLGRSDPGFVMGPILGVAAPRD